MSSESTKVVNKHVASPPPENPGFSIVPTSGKAKGKLEYHVGPDVQRFGHVKLGDGKPVCEIKGGKIHVLQPSAPGEGRPSSGAGGHALSDQAAREPVGGARADAGKVVQLGDASEASDVIKRGDQAVAGGSV